MPCAKPLTCDPVSPRHDQIARFWKHIKKKMHVLSASTAALLSLFGVPKTVVGATDKAPLVLEAKIPLGAVEGRIDHMAFDAKRERLFVAELGNDTVAVMSLPDRKVIRIIDNLKEPQGVGYLGSSDTLYIANGGDGTVGTYDGDNYRLRRRLDLKDDADNIRVDANTNQIFVGYGSGAIAVINSATGQQVGNAALKGHPESFQLSRDGQRIFVNVPTARAVAVVDRAASKQVAQWSVRYQGNFPMALDEQNRRVLVGFRSPPRLSAYAMTDGAHWGTIEICGDTDDVFFDAKRSRVYVTCGEGMVDILESRDTGFARLARIPTEPGARTALFSPELDRLFVAVRASPVEPAGIWIFRPDP
jgi:DNA-binding beta-propeller fold protein YncE